ncbi:hypothetical protein GQ53DRAFT_676257 [Thozetella sp. PMI_491]|nr:hypothetical protein GQ53DRAFT_676257 [Thozetella sp. PMI_491]
MAVGNGEVSALSAHASSDSGLQAILHPLPILEISDYITRASERGYEGAIVGALLGQMNGRDITIEHSFPVKTDDNGASHEINLPWFRERLNQMKQVHKEPPLDLVGWYALVPKHGPTNLHAAIHEAFSQDNDSLIFLGFHLDELLHPVDASLPITIYEGEPETDDGVKAAAGGEDLEMTDASNTSLKFRALPYVTETGEAEMIAMQFIREGGANASLEGGSGDKRIAESAEKKVAVDADTKGKRRAVSKEEEVKEKEATTSTNKDASLSKEEVEFVSALQTRANAIKMMKSRIAIIIAYLQKLPPEFADGKLSSAEVAEAAAASGGQYLRPSNNILRQIQALVTNIELATPTQSKALKTEILQETNDVELLSMISALVSSVEEVREAGKKFAVVEAARTQKARQVMEASGFSSQGFSNAGDLIL